MWLEKINLLNFKNYQELEIQFSKQINSFVGENGSGKTNLLDAIYYLSLTKSAFSTVEAQNIQHGSSFFLIRGLIHKADHHYQIQFSLQNGQKKLAKNNGANYERISEHIGLFPVVLITPDDTDIIKGGSELRRKFFDGLISQIDTVYLDNLISYNRVLKQRNSLLKQMADHQAYDTDLLDSYSAQLVDFGAKIYMYRKAFISSFYPVFITHYNNISSQKERVEIHYQSDFASETYEEEFYQNYRRDMAAQRTTGGIHKDEFEFKINGFPVKKYGSQGQQKSFVIALKLAQFDIIKDEKGVKPILLLDDIFDKLDDFRISKLVEMVARHSFGQLFITDARPERTQTIFQSVDAERKVFTISQGSVVQQELLKRKKDQPDNEQYR